MIYLQGIFCICIFNCLIHVYDITTCYSVKIKIKPTKIIHSCCHLFQCKWFIDVLYLNIVRTAFAF